MSKPTGEGISEWEKEKEREREAEEEGENSFNLHDGRVASPG